jgi:hypothetical protein
MPNYGHTAICPFYMGEKPKTISCEDAFRRFKDERRRDAWTNMYCYEWDWMKCPYAVDLNEAYARLEKGDNKALEKHEIEALKKELRSISTKLGKAEKRIERQQRKIDELRTVNQSLTNINIQLDQRMKRYYKDAQKAKEQLHEYEQKIDAQVKKIAEVYEQRLAYMIETHAPGRRLYEDEIKEWAENKAFAIIYDKDEYGDCWKVVFKKDEDEDIPDEKPEE